MPSQSVLIRSLWKEDFAAPLDRVLGGLDTVPHRPGIVIDFIIVPSRGRLIPEEVDGVKPLVVEHVEAVALVPAFREDVKADHAACQQKGGHQQRGGDAVGCPLPRERAGCERGALPTQWPGTSSALWLAGTELGGWQMLFL